MKRDQTEQQNKAFNEIFTMYTLLCEVKMTYTLVTPVVIYTEIVWIHPFY